jgi:hypothetical protein
MPPPLSTSLQITHTRVATALPPPQLLRAQKKDNGRKKKDNRRNEEALKRLESAGSEMTPDLG